MCRHPRLPVAPDPLGSAWENATDRAVPFAPINGKIFLIHGVDDRVLEDFAHSDYTRIGQIHSLIAIFSHQSEQRDFVRGQFESDLQISGRQQLQTRLRRFENGGDFGKDWFANQPGRLFVLKKFPRPGMAGIALIQGRDDQSRVSDLFQLALSGPRELRRLNCLASGISRVNACSQSGVSA